MRYTDERLDSLRLVGDPIPDRLIEELARDQSLAEVNRTMRHLVANDHPIPEELPDNVERWLHETDSLPDWADRARLDRGHAFFVEHGPMIALILSTASLVECYAAEKGCRALAFSYRLGQNAYRRIAETAQFLLRVMVPGALYEGGSGIPAVQKVRLMHSAIRFLIRQTGRWDEAALGVPLCQEDMLGTLMAFSYIPIRNLRRMGTQVSAVEAEDYFYMWRVLGEMIGVLPDALPASVAEGQEAWDRIAARHHCASEPGVAMTRALLEFHADVIPGTLFDNLIPAVIRWQVGDQIADWMAIPRTRWDRIVPHKAKLVRALDLLDRGSGRAADAMDRLALAYLDRRFFELNGYERTGFEIPTELRAAWHLLEPDAERGRG